MKEEVLFMQQNILVTVFNVESEAYQAIAELKQQYRGNSWFVMEAALIKKEGESFKTIYQFDIKVHTPDDTVIAQFIGMCVVVLAARSVCFLVQAMEHLSETVSM